MKDKKKKSFLWFGKSPEKPLSVDIEGSQPMPYNFLSNTSHEWRFKNIKHQGEFGQFRRKNI